MTQKLYKTYASDDGKLEAKVYHDADYGEYVVKFYRDGVHQQFANYHTDKCDANGTASRFVKGEPTGTLLITGQVIGQNPPDSAAAAPESKSMNGVELATFIGSAAPVPEFRAMSNAEFADIVGPLIQRGIRFDLALDGYLTARLTWNGGDTVQAIGQDGSRFNIAMPGVTGKVPA